MSRQYQVSMAVVVRGEVTADNEHEARRIVRSLMVDGVNKTRSLYIAESVVEAHEMLPPEPTDKGESE